MDKLNLNGSIFIVPVIDKYLLYSPLQDLSALLNLNAVNKIKSAILTQSIEINSDELSDLIATVQNHSLINPNRIGDLDPLFLGIIPSRRCNMSCVYCDFKANQSPQKTIDPIMVTTAIDYYIRLIKKQKKKTVNIQFFGGEPFIEQEIIDIAVHYTRQIAAKEGLVPYFEVLSNGYFSTEQLIFIKDYFDRIVISFDGFKKYHNRTRPLNRNSGTFETVKESLKYLSTKNIELAIRCCITSESVNDMVEIAGWFCNEFNPEIVNFETLTENKETKKRGLYAPNPYVFARNCIMSWRILREKSVISAYAPVSINSVQTSSCPVGKDALIVHPDGMIASCYLVKDDWEKKNLDFTFGKISKKGDLDIDIYKMKNLRNPVNNKMRCKDCFCKFGCSGNCHVNTTFPDSKNEYTDFCVQTRIITLCRLLENMGMQSLVDELLLNNKINNYLSLNTSDKILHFDENKKDKNDL